MSCPRYGEGCGMAQPPPVSAALEPPTLRRTVHGSLVLGPPGPVQQNLEQDDKHDEMDGNDQAEADHT
jgi:hypothetical protein